MASIKMFESSNLHIGLWIGKNGAGKTADAISFLRQGPIKVYDIDKRIRGFLGMKKHYTQEELDRIDVFRLKEPTWECLDAELEMDIVKQKTGQFRYKTVLIDSAASLQKMFLRDSQERREGKNKKGKERGGLIFLHPDDYNYSSLAFFQFFQDYALKLQCNFIVTCWLVDKYGKPTGEGKEYAPNEVIGQKLTLTEKVSEEVPGYFDEIYVFEKEDSTLYPSGVKHSVTFYSSIAKTAHPELLEVRKLDITNKIFYDVWKDLITPKTVEETVKK